MCPLCRAALARCVCGKRAAASASDGTVRVSRESKGRGGKTVTVVKGVPLEGEQLTALARQLKTVCGSGGTLKEGVIEIQGDHVAAVMDQLKPHGWPLKRTGG